MPNTSGPVTGAFTTFTLPRNDDGSTGSINLGFTANFFGSSHNTLFVNNNGNVTFNGPYSTYTPFGIGAGYTGQPIIAAFFADVDTDGAASGIVSYGRGVYNGHTAFGVEYPNVGYYSGHTNLLNTFEIILTDRSDTGAGNFDIYFNYNTVQWETGDASGGSGGFGGSPAAAGFSAGTNQAGTYYMFPGSLLSHTLIDNGPNALAMGTNDGVTGQYLFEVRGGLVTAGGITGGGSQEPPPPPRPVSFSVTAPWQFEGNIGHTAFDVVIHRSGGDLAVASAVNWELTTGDVADFAPGQAFAGVVEFGAGQTQAIVTLEVVGDRIAEPDDWFNFVLTNVTHGDAAWNPGASDTGVIMNDDRALNFDFSGPLMRMEGSNGSTPFEFLVMRSGDLTVASTVHWQVDFGTADAQDFAPGAALSGDTAFLPGQSRATISIAVAGDTRTEPDENFTVRLTSVSTGGGPPTTLDVATTGTILDDDVPLSQLVGSPSVLVMPEGDTGFTNFTFSVMRVGDVSGAASTPFTISLGAGGLSAAEIHSAMNGAVNFAAGAITATLTVQIVADLIPEGDESFLVTLGGGEFNTLLLTGVVMNDDKTTGSASGSTALASPLQGDVSPFMEHLTGGGLWSDGPPV